MLREDGRGLPLLRHPGRLRRRLEQVVCFLRLPAPLRARGTTPVPVVLTFSPCGSPRTLALLKWLGIAVPRWLENELLDARDALRHLRAARQESIAADVLSFAHDRQIPVGINVESVSIASE